MTDLVQTCLACPPGRPRQADSGRVCWHCSNRILGWLRELEDYLPVLSLEKMVRSSERGTPGFASAPPVALDAILHTDPRSDTSNRHGELADELGALGIIDQWTRVVVDERGVTPPLTAYLGIGLLRTHHAWITCQGWVDEYAADIRHVHHAVRAVAGDPVPRSVGRCITVHQHGECGGRVYERPDEGDVQCSTCHRVYDGTDLVRFRAQQEAGA